KTDETAKFCSNCGSAYPKQIFKLKDLLKEIIQISGTQIYDSKELEGAKYTSTIEQSKVSVGSFSITSIFRGSYAEENSNKPFPIDGKYLWEPNLEMLNVDTSSSS